MTEALRDQQPTPIQLTHTEAHCLLVLCEDRERELEHKREREMRSTEEQFEQLQLLKIITKLAKAGALS